ncbi:hypothetical protein STAQ_16570 [Allostella sp. ATCC 35155]|nr:hypothetical protein STAQ_16570 [Stella sp. ATCC 35155]
MTDRIFLHVGPHKTGTTAIQRALSRTPGIVYPAVPAMGPGHALAAWEAIGAEGRTADPDRLVRIVAEAGRPGAPLVLSAEDFCRAAMPGHDAEALRRLAAAHPVALVVTLTPLVRRLPSMAQEMVKHGTVLDLRSEADLRALMAREAGLQPDLPERLAALAPWAHMHFVLADAARPRRLFAGFSRLLGVPVAPDPADGAYENRRWPYAAIAIQARLNEIAVGLDRTQVRIAGRDAAEAALRSMPRLAALPYPPLPAPLARELAAIWRRQLARIRGWVREGRATLYR